MRLLIEPQYFPPGIFFSYLIDKSHKVFFLCERYRKMTFRNRCTIAGANGPINLSVPIIGGREQHTLLKDVRIDNRQQWQLQQWKSICSCYNHSPWFEYYHDSLKIFFEKPFERLIDLNVDAFTWVRSQLQLEVSFEIVTARQEADIDLVDHFTPKALREKAPHILYTQLFEERTGFIPHLSILDLLFCSGKSSLNFLRTHASQQTLNK